MATFTDEIRISIITDDQSSVVLQNTYTMTDIGQVFEFSGIGGDPTATFPAGDGDAPVIDSDPIMLVCTYLGNGEGDITVTNDDTSDEASFSLRKGQQITMHGPTCFLRDNAGTATAITTAWERLLCNGAPGKGFYRVMALMGEIS